MKPLAVCAIFKNEASYLLEWIACHRVVGFDHLVLHDNDGSDSGTDLIRSSCAADSVTVIHWPEWSGQLSAYRIRCVHILTPTIPPYRGTCSGFASAADCRYPAA
jgi:hypothetical protein